MLGRSEQSLGTELGWRQGAERVQTVGSSLVSRRPLASPRPAGEDELLSGNMFPEQLFPALNHSFSRMIAS